MKKLIVILHKLNLMTIPNQTKWINKINKNKH